MGSPDTRRAATTTKARSTRSKIAPFWMGKCEITWDEYESGCSDLDIQRRELPERAAERPRRRRARDSSNHAADEALHRHDLRHGQEGLSGDLHDAARGQANIANGSAAKTGQLLPPADRGRMGIRLPRRHDDGLFLRRRPGELERVRLVRRQQRREVSARSARRSPTRGACTTCTATWPEWCLDQYDADFYAKFDADKAVGTAGDARSAVSARRPRRLVGRRPPTQLRAAPRRLDRRLEAARTRRSPRASGTTPTPCSSASASCVRWSSRTRGCRRTEPRLGQEPITVSRTASQRVGS